ncbi:MAG: VWA domain-containing protein [Candidatus Nanoarchaeia archaeon]|nr:VWA domain-containing protein [Candidatus Nanoarchaeia archaeon]
MPKLNDQNLEKVGIKGTSFVYSATRIKELGATDYTLVSIIVDRSGSVGQFKTDLENAIKEIIKSCKYSPRADNLMIQLASFADDVTEEHGFKLLQNCNADDYTDILKCGGMTALFDASFDAISATVDYGKNLVKNNFNVNAIVFVLTDGDDNHSSLTAKQVEEVLKKSVKDEIVESMVSVLIGVGVDPDVDKYLDNYYKTAGFTQYVKIDQANAKTLAKLAQFVSKSISSQSQSLAKGTAFQPQSLTI